MKLERLEARVAALLQALPRRLTFEEFQEKWKTMSDLDKSLYAGIAECPELFYLYNEKEAAKIRGYLAEMGVVTEKVELQPIIEELNAMKD